MKKILICVLCSTTIMCTGVISFAAEANNVLVSQKPIAVVAQQNVTQDYTLKINGSAVELGTLKIIKMKDQIMIPIRITSESLGFKVTWDQKKKVIHLEDDRMQSDLSFGIDNYCAYSIKAIGMTAPVSLGVPPTMINGSAYVPINYYQTLLADSECVSIKGDEISIFYNSGESKQENTQLSNPLVDYRTIDEARKAVGFTFSAPTNIPSEYKMQDIIVISNQLANIFYRQGENEILYRTAKGEADISGDYNIYSITNNITIGDSKITIKGNSENIKLATWINGGISYSLSFDVPVDQKTLSNIIESIK